MVMKDNGVAAFLEVISEEKDLGVWIDDKLKFTKHIGHAVAKGNQILGLIKRSFVYKDSEVIKRLFIAHVRPHLEYVNVVFLPRFKRCRTNRESSEACYKVSFKVMQHVIRKSFKGYESTIPGVPQIQR